MSFKPACDNRHWGRGGYLKPIRHSRPNKVRDAIRTLKTELNLPHADVAQFQRLHDMAKYGGNAAQRRKLRRAAERWAKQMEKEHALT